MIKHLKFIACSWIFLLIFSCFAFAQSIKIIDLVEGGRGYDGKEISVEGEVIGHLMKRGDFVWFNIDDQTASIGIWADFDLAAKIKYLGRHAVRGDRVRIDGKFHSHCPMHGGDTDIHAHRIVIVKRGAPQILTYDNKKVNILIFIAGALLCLYIIKILKRQR